MPPQIMKAHMLLDAGHCQQLAVDPGTPHPGPERPVRGDGNRMGLSGCCLCSRTRMSTACWDSATLRTEFLVFGSVITSSPSMRVTCLLTDSIRSFTFRSSHRSASSSPRRRPLDSSRKNMGRTPYFSASRKYTPSFSVGRRSISRCSLRGMRQLSQGLYG